MHKIKKISGIILAIVFGLPMVLSIILFVITLYMYSTADFMQPDIKVDMDRYESATCADSVKVTDYGTLSLNRHGLWEAKLYGNSIDRGAAYGIMSKELLKYQEDVFVEQIHEIIPSEWWIEFLHKIIIVFNRNMARHIPLEYREEIYAMSLSCTEEYNSYGTPYLRQLNYHAAHDIGHAMQQYMLVGCSSFATWSEESADEELLIGRNFDFYVGDNFARNKVILFVEPTEGHKFMSVSWPGMMGVLSGMNEKGLTVTINAAKGTIPVSSAMPISLLARQILQYASNISEAYEIARQFETFVSESLLIGSASDGYAAIIEKTPEKIALFRSHDNRIVCTNHYQSETFINDSHNTENIRTSDSPYRAERINELLDDMSPISPDDAVYILRNRYGMENKDIGICNEKSINQFIAHHSVVFQPEKLRMWVSTSPWQLGEYICYDMNEVFKERIPVKSYVIEELNIAADSQLLNNEYKRAVKYREQYKSISRAIDNNSRITESEIEEFISNNPNHFQVYNRLGDYMISINDTNKAISYWQKAISLEIPRLEEREEIIKRIQQYD